jgi:hypothetical protein
LEIQQPSKEHIPSIPFLIFLREAIKGGYKPTLEEKVMLQKYQIKAIKSNPKTAGIRQSNLIKAEAYE